MKIKAIYAPGFSCPVHCAIIGRELTGISDNIIEYTIKVTSRKDKIYQYGTEIKCFGNDIFDSFSFWKRTGKFRLKGKDWQKELKA